MIKNQLKKFEKSEKGVHVARTEWDKTKKLVQNIISTTKTDYGIQLYFREINYSFSITNNTINDVIKTFKNKDCFIIDSLNYPLGIGEDEIRRKDGKVTEKKTSLEPKNGPSIVFFRCLMEWLQQLYIPVLQKLQNMRMIILYIKSIEALQKYQKKKLEKY